MEGIRKKRIQAIFTSHPSGNSSLGKNYQTSAQYLYGINTDFWPNVLVLNSLRICYVRTQKTLQVRVFFLDKKMRTERFFCAL
jgi:hypothetical protein